MADQRRAGPIQLQVNGEIYDAKGAFSYNPGAMKRETILGQDKVHGYKETVQAPFVEGTITDRGSLVLKDIVNAKDVTVSIGLPNGKMFILSEAWFAGDGTVTTEEAEIEVRWEGMNGEEV